MIERIATDGQHLAGIRDAHLPLWVSCRLRLGTRDELRTERFLLTACVTFDEITIDDLFWALYAAALRPTATHLYLTFRPNPSPLPNPDRRLYDLREELHRNGISPCTLTASLDRDGKEQSSIEIALFTHEEYTLNF